MLIDLRRHVSRGMSTDARTITDKNKDLVAQIYRYFRNVCSSASFRLCAGRELRHDDSMNNP